METNAGPTAEKPRAARISSMDQFRGYTVAGMFVVNFVGGLAAFPEVLKHHNGLPYFSYADTIMPSFMFAAGFSYRLQHSQTVRPGEPMAQYRHFVVRSLALVLISLAMYASGDVDFKKWAPKYDLQLVSAVPDAGALPRQGKNLIVVAQVGNDLHFRTFDSEGAMVVDRDGNSLPEEAGQVEELGRQLKGLWPPHELSGSEKDQLIPTLTSIAGPSGWVTAWRIVGGLLKANLWEVLAIIGVVQILILPVIASSARVRTIALIACAAIHLLISYSFNFAFVYGKPNWMDDRFWGLTGESAWDGGFFGVLGWAIPMLLGTITYDIISSNGPWKAAGKALGLGLGLMSLGYASNCLTTLYDTDKGDVRSSRQRGREPCASAVRERGWSGDGDAGCAAAVHAAAATFDPPAQLLDDEQESREPAVHAVLLGIRPGRLCDLRAAMRSLGPLDRGLPDAGHEPAGCLHHSSLRRSVRAHVRTQRFASLVRRRGAGGLLHHHLSVRPLSRETRVLSAALMRGSSFRRIRAQATSILAENQLATVSRREGLVDAPFHPRRYAWNGSRAAVTVAR